MLVPIPLSGKRARKRGYNQAYILAKQIGRQLSLSVVDALARTKDTKPQFGLTKSERFNNMKNTFNIKDTFRKTRSSVVHHASILLVDDVLTTGATVMEAAKVLKKNGIQKVWALCVAAD